MTISELLALSGLVGIAAALFGYMSVGRFLTPEMTEAMKSKLGLRTALQNLAIVALAISLSLAPNHLAWLFGAVLVVLLIVTFPAGLRLLKEIGAPKQALLRQAVSQLLGVVGLTLYSFGIYLGFSFGFLFGTS